MDCSVQLRCTCWRAQRKWLSFSKLWILGEPNCIAQENTEMRAQKVVELREGENHPVPI